MPDERRAEPLVLRTEEFLFTSLLGCGGIGVVSGNMRVVEPVRDRASEGLEFVTAADPGREVGVRLESRDVDMLEKRRSQDRGRALLGVLTCDGGPSSNCIGLFSMFKPVLVPGDQLLFCRVPPLEYDVPCSSQPVKRVSGEEKERFEVYSEVVRRDWVMGIVYVEATAVMSELAWVSTSARPSTRPMAEREAAAPVAQSVGTVLIACSTHRRLEGGERHAIDSCSS